MATLTKPLLCSGNVFLSTYGTGAIVDGVGPIEQDAFTITPSVERIEQTSKAVETYGQTRSSIPLPGKTELAMTFLDLPAETWEMLLLGTQTTWTQGSGSATDENVVGVLDKWVSMANKNLTSGTVNVEDDGGGTPWVEGTDYEINYRLGWFKALTANCVGAMDVDYDYVAIDGQKVDISTQSQVIRRVTFDGVNLHDNGLVQLDAYQVRLAPTAPVDLKAGQHATGGVSGVMETPTGASTPGYLYLG